MTDLSTLTQQELEQHIKQVCDNPTVQSLSDCMWELSRRIKALDWDVPMQYTTTPPDSPDLDKFIRDIL